MVLDWAGKHRLSNISKQGINLSGTRWENTRRDAGVLFLSQNNQAEMIYIENNSLSLLHTNYNYGRDK